MKRFIFIVAFITLVLPSKIFAQNCFGEFDNIVSSLACVDYEMGFEVNQTAASISNPVQPVYVYDTEDGFTKLVSSWFILQRSGKTFNIHQYGFRLPSGTDIIVIYKVLDKDKRVEFAVTIQGKALYHGISELTEDEYGYYRTGYLKGTDGQHDITSLFVLDKNSRLSLSAFGGMIIKLRT